MNDLKLFTKYDDDIQGLLNTVEIFCDDIVMYVGPKEICESHI